MTLNDFDSLAVRLAARLRIHRAAARTLLPAGLLLGLAASVLAVTRLWGLAWPLAGPVLAATAVLCAVAIFVLAWGLRPVSRLAAAVELDRLAGLKERAASLAALRAGAVRSGRLAPELEADTARALEPLLASEVLGRAAPMPGGVRWLAVLLAALLAGLLVPSRDAGRRLSLADVLVGGGQLLRGLESASAGDGAAQGAAGTARRALTLIKAPPPRDPEEARRRAEQMKQLAAELRSRGAADQAARLEQAARSLWNDEAVRPVGDSGGLASGRGSFEGRGRYPAEYAELLERYFSGEDG